MDTIAIIDEILKKLGLQSEASGLRRATLTVEIAKYLFVLKDEIEKERVTHRQETDLLKRQLSVYTDPSEEVKEENQNAGTK